MKLSGRSSVEHAILVMTLKVLSFVVFFTTTLFGPNAAAQWTQYRGPQGDGITSEQLPEKIILMEPLWRIPLNTGFSSFVNNENSVYTIVRRTHEGSDYETLLALDSDTGKERWAQPLTFLRYGHDGGQSGARGNDGGDGPRSTPAVLDGRVFAIDADLRVYAFDANGGNLIWKHDLMREYGGRNIKWKNAASPLLDEGRLYMAGGGAGQSFLAFDQKTGKLLWKSGDALMTHATPIATTLHGQRQILFFNQKGVTATDAGSGKVLWHHDFPFSVSTAASPVLFEDIVYCSAGYGVGATAFKVERSGAGYSTAELWRHSGNDLANHWSTPVCRDGYLYGLYGFKQYGDAPLACVDIKTGKMLWQEKGFGPGHLIRAGDRLLVLGDAGQLAVVAADPKGYRELAKGDLLDGKCWTTPILSNGRVFARSTKEGICLSLGTKS